MVQGKQGVFSVAVIDNGAGVISPVFYGANKTRSIELENELEMLIWHITSQICH